MRPAFLRSALSLLLVALISLPQAGYAQEPARRVLPPGYQDVYIEEDGCVTPETLAALSAGIRAEAKGAPSQIVVLVHGYNTSYSLGRRQYRKIARLLREEARQQGWRPIVVGVHWPSYPGPPARWLPQMLGYRFLSAAGFPNAVPNPYLEKVEVAARAGRRGMRSILFRLKDDFPGWPIHALAHSMGSEVVVRALAPNAGAGETPVTCPERELRLRLVVLAGADLDQDVFAPGEEEGVAAALPRAAVWWITVPRRNTADVALELRRAAGRRDAMGNVGLTLAREQFETLMARRGLVIDSRSVPIGHDITDYYSADRLRAITAAMRYLQQPEDPAVSGSVLATLDRILKADAGRLPEAEKVRGASAKLYVRWRREPGRDRYGTVRLVVPDRTAPVPLSPAGAFAY